MDNETLIGALDYFIENKLTEVAQRLPTLVHLDAASFACGVNTGYKNCLLDLLHYFKNTEFYLEDNNENYE